MNKKIIQKYYKKIYILGTGKFAFQCAKLVQQYIDVDCVYEYGSYVQSKLNELCIKNDITYMQLITSDIAEDIMKKIITLQEKTLIISASNLYIFPEWICTNDNVNIINYHPALLNKHLGRNAEAWTIWEGDRETGITWHQVNRDIDKGKIFVEKKFLLDERVSSLQLMIIQYQMGLEGLKEVIESLLCNEIVEYKEVKTYGKMHYSKEKPNNGVLEENWNEDKISAFLRSMDYGILEVLGKPCIIENNKKYEWYGYQILSNLEDRKFNIADKVIKKENYLFVLQNYHEKED